MGDEAGPDINAPHCSRGVAFGDFDNDGDMDVLIMNVNEPPTLLCNDAPKENHWIKIRLQGTRSNRSAIGTRVAVHYGAKVQVQEALSGCSFLSSNNPRLHFGLGSATTAEIEIHWPSGLVERLHAPVDQLVTLREGTGQVKGPLSLLGQSLDCCNAGDHDVVAQATSSRLRRAIWSGHVRDDIARQIVRQQLLSRGGPIVKDDSGGGGGTPQWRKHVS